MHGWAHNRKCQCEYHPLYTKGAGLTDFEMCERFFAASNLVAVLTRHATEFHRLQYLDMHYSQSDREKYENLGKFTFNNYRQALQILENEAVVLEEITRTKGWTGKDYEDWMEQERSWLEDLRREPEEDMFRCMYLESLERLWKME